jgi:multiple sugar transport system ATP-binding protein
MRVVLAPAARSAAKAETAAPHGSTSAEPGGAGAVVEELGADAYAFCVGEVAGSEVKLVARADARHPPALGERVSLRPREGEAHLFDPATGERLGA